MTTPLSDKMRALASKLERETGGGELGPLMHAAGQVAELRARADELDKADLADMRAFLGAWARARRLYSGISGEPLI